MTVELISSEVLKLSRLQRIEIIRLLVDSIANEEKGQDDQGVAQAQAEEIDRRLARFDAGEAKAISGELVHAELAQKYGLQLSTPS
jgi:putative addiction module component (TIGR02574 family)